MIQFVSRDGKGRNIMELELKVFFWILFKRLWFICGVIAMICGATAVHHTQYTQPIYKASSKLIVNTSNPVEGLGRPNSNDISSNMMLIGTYKEIISSSAIMEKVKKENPEITLGLNELISAVHVASNSGSQVISISIKETSLEQAVSTVNTIAKVFKSEIPEIMNVDNVTILSEAKSTDNPDPVSYGLLFKLIIALLISLMLSIGIVVLWEYLDDTIKSEKDVSVYLGIPTLGVIAKMQKSDLNSNRSKKNMVGENIHVSVGQ